MFWKGLNFIKKETLAQMFSCECCKIAKNTFSYRAPLVAASVTYDNTALTRRKGRWILLSARTALKHNLAHVFFDILPQKHGFKIFIFLLEETEMAQNSSLFVWKTSNYNRGRSSLRNGMKQVTNLRSLGFTQERIVKLLRVFPEVVLYDIDFSGLFDVPLWSPYFSNRPFWCRPCCKTSIICISCWSRWFTSANP